MNDKLTITRYDNHVVVLTFNRPEALNAMDIETMHAFRLTVNKLAGDRQLCAVVLTGAGDKAFCSGGDLWELSKRPSEADGRELASLMGDTLHQLEQLPVPVIAAINGYALGGGSEIALACDMRIADENVKMGMVQIRMALTPGWGAGQRLLRVVGYARAMEILMKGERLTANDVQALGLVNTIVPAGTALETALQLAGQIADSPPAVIRGIKQLLQAGRIYPYEQALQMERDVFPPLWADEPHLQAVQAFIDRQSNKRDS